MRYDTIVRGGRAVLPERGVVACDLAIADGRIAGILEPGARAEAAEVLDATGLVVLPGLVDGHVHFGMGSPDDWASESRAAAQGGVTTVINYAQSPDSYLEVEPAERALAAATSLVDFALHCIVMNEGHLAEVDRLVDEHDVWSFKYFSNIKGDEGARLGIPGTDTGFFYALARAVARHPEAVLAVHPENVETIWRLTAEQRAAGAEGLPAWNAARPAFAEAHDIFTTLLFAQETGCRVYVPHLTSAAGLDVVRRFGASDRVHVETCPHYLTLTVDAPEGVVAKVNPPVRTAEDVEALWGALADGTIDTVGSDHISRLEAVKEGSIWQAQPGFPGVSTLLPVLLHEGHHRRGLPLERIVELTATNPARIFRLAPTKGSIAPGADADLVLVDLDRRRTVAAAEIDSHADYSVYEGRELQGWPVATLVRGTPVMRDGEVVGEAGHGRHVPRRAAAPAAQELSRV
jgi:dihydroorotase (multifunctional complex type)